MSRSFFRCLLALVVVAGIMPAGAQNLNVSGSIARHAARHLSLSLSRRTPPPYFFAGGPLPVKLVFNAAGATASDRYSTNYATATFRNTGTTYYVGQVSSGCSDANTGLSQGACWATLQHANDTAAGSTQIMIADGRYAPVSITKNISFIAQNSGKVYVGTFAANSDVSSWGTPSGGHQTITTGSGVIIHGFVDTANLMPSYLGGAPTVAQYCPDTTCLSSNQAVGRAGIIWSYTAGVNSTLEASDGRDLTNKFDTEILAWLKGAPAPLAVAGGVQFYSFGIYYVGGTQRTVGTAATVATMIMEGGGGLGEGANNGLTDGDESDQVFSIHGTFVMKSAVMIGSNIPYQDVLDFASGQKGIGVAIDSYLGQAGGTSGSYGTQAITMHNGIGILVVNCTFFDDEQDFGDVGPVMHGIFNVKHRGGRYASGNTLNLLDANSEFHVADLTMVDPAPGSAGQTAGGMYDYDGSTTGLDLTPITGAKYDWKGLSDLTSDAILSEIIVDKPYLFQDSGCSTPVTASGQGVVCVKDAVVSGQYYLVTLGTVTYTEGALKSLTFGGTNGAVLQLNGRVDPFGVTDVIVGTKTSDTSFDYTASPNPSANTPIYGMAWTSGLAPWINVWAGTVATAKVDGVTKTTKTALSSAVANGAAHVFTSENNDMNFYLFRNIVLMGGGPTNTTYSYTGEFYGSIISRHTGNTTVFNANKAIIQTASGL